MITPNDVQAAVVAALRIKLPQVSVEAHGGIFDDKELGRYGALCPAVRVAVPGFGAFGRSSSGETIIPMSFAAVCLAKEVVPLGAPKVERLAAVQALATAVGLAVDKNQFDVEGLYPPEDLRAQNQYSSKGDDLGIAIWQVLWTSRLVTGETIDQSLAALQTLYVDGVLFSGSGAPSGADPLRDAPTETVVTGGTP